MRDERRAPPRARGIYVPIEEVELHLLFGWTVADDCAGSAEILMWPPELKREEAA